MIRFREKNGVWPLVFETMMKREEDWSLGKYQVNGRDIGSTTYFRIHL